jgi:hypothetical protein
VDPPITGGFPIQLLPNLSLNVFVTYQAGNKIRLYPAFRSAYSDLDAMLKEFLIVGKFGDEKVTNIPAIWMYYSYVTGHWFLSHNNYNYSTVSSGWQFCD